MSGERSPPPIPVVQVPWPPPPPPLAPPPNVGLLWSAVFQRSQVRWALAIAGLAALVACTLGSLTGPATVNWTGRPPLNARLQMQIIGLGAAWGGLLFALSAWRLRGFLGVVPLVVGGVVLYLGTYLGSISVPWQPAGAACTPNCGFVQPYGLTGGVLGVWGFTAILGWLLLLLVLWLAHAQRRRAAARGPHPYYWPPHVMPRAPPPPPSGPL